MGCIQGAYKVGTKAMPPKASTSSKDGGKEKGKPKDEGPTLQEFVDAVRAGSVTVRGCTTGVPTTQLCCLLLLLLLTGLCLLCAQTPDGKLVKRGDALLKVWSVALLGEDQVSSSPTHSD